MKQEIFDSTPTYHLPPEIVTLVGNLPFSENTVGMSDSHVLIYPDSVLKIEPVNPTSVREAQMLSWLDDRLPAPRVRCCVTENGIQYLLMTRLNGKIACDRDYLSAPRRLAGLLAEALETVWSLDVSGCPHTTTLDDRLAFDRRVLENGDEAALCAPIAYRGHRFPDAYRLYEWLLANRPTEHPAFSHGDFCLPNVFFSGDTLSGFLDLGQAGISDRAYDLALCLRSLWYNLAGVYGGAASPDAETDALLLFDALGIRPDFDVLDYYNLLDLIG
ncbi:MAG: aminoglycoside 3'-phosphotransferase [Clostridia bacterium]|nr:aminoglycoside 3'-phosphotransferase [Clostridia bacterium]